MVSDAGGGGHGAAGDVGGPEPERRGGRLRRAGARIAGGARRLDSSPAAVALARRMRGLLPGDSDYGDPLSTAGPKGSDALARRLSEAAADRPGLLREMGLSGMQVWQALSEAQGRGRGDRELTILFTDLVEFSDWALAAGDDRALELLREVGRALEPPVKRHGGEVVKRLGDGMMAVFEEPQAAYDALCEACEGLRRIEADDYAPQIRAGLHRGRPRRLGGDYLGVDVNVAARVGEEAGRNELLVTDRVLEALDTGELNARKKRFFRVKGVPGDVQAYSLPLDPT